MKGSIRGLEVPISRENIIQKIIIGELLGYLIAFFNTYLPIPT